jgi:hypothetical protein
MTLKWDYKNRTCDISISKFQHEAPKHPQHTPSRYVTSIYGANTQYATEDETLPLTSTQCLTIQKITGSVLYYARAVDPTVLMPLNDIATEQTRATEKTQVATNQMLDYLATHLDATIRYHTSGMILHIHSDASYLSVSNARGSAHVLLPQSTPTVDISQAYRPDRINKRNGKKRGNDCRRKNIQG